jgi:hypothetical protein
MLAPNQKVLKARRNANKRLRRFRERQKNGDVLLRLTLNEQRVAFVLEQMGLLTPTGEHSVLQLEQLLNQVVSDWLEGWG